MDKSQIRIFCKRTKGLMENRNVTIEEMANLIKIDDEVLDMTLCGCIEPEGEIIDSIAKILHCSAAYLMGASYSTDSYLL